MFNTDTLTPADLEELLQTDKPGTVNSAVDVSKRLWAINKIQEDIEQTKRDAADHAAYFKSVIEGQERQVELLRSQIHAWLINTERKNVRTPLGTCSAGERTVTSWPDADTLINFAKQYAPDAVTVVTTEQVSKAELKKYIKQSGVYPPGYQSHKEPNLTIRKASAKDEPKTGGGDGWSI